jgi:hypothetical protein
MEMLSETCGVSNSNSKRHLDVFNREKGIRDQNGCSTSARYSNLMLAMIQLSLRLLAFAAAGDCAR